jgi:hypothetical protein
MKLLSPRLQTADYWPGQVSPAFVRLASICALLTTLTTLAVHWLPELWKDAVTFEAQVQLRHNPIYLSRLWIVLLHCVLVVISMAAIPRLLGGTSRLVATVGFGSYAMFAFVEMLRTSLSIFAVNRAWRSGYELAIDDVKRATFRSAIDSFSGINDALFFLFLLAFVVGLFCYGFALLSKKGIDQCIAWLFVLWALLSLPGLIGAIVGNESFAAGFGWVGPYFQLSARLLIGLWLWSVSKRLQSALNSSRKL